MSFIRPTDLKKTKAYPAAAATATSDAIDLLDSTPSLKLRNAEIEVALPAVAALVDTKKATATIQHSDDNSSFAAVDTLATVIQTGAGGAGAAAVTKRFKASADLKRYVRLSVAVESGGGDNTAASSTLSVVY
jgi:hypothetical protein